MSIKEFSQKNSETLFYISIVLLIISIVLGICLCCNDRKSGKGGPGNFNEQMRNNGRMMQNNDIRPNTQKTNFPTGDQNTTDQGIPSTDGTSAPVAPATTPIVQ